MIRGKIKSFSVLLVFLVSILAVAGVASAETGDLDATIDFVKVDGDTMDPGATATYVQDIKKDNTFDVRVHFIALADMENVEIEVEMAGYDHSDKISETSDVIPTVKAGKGYTEDLQIKLPARMESDHYTLWVYVKNRTAVLMEYYEFDVTSVSHSIVIKDVDVDPATEVEAGRSMRAIVKVKNYGEKDEDDVKVEFMIPELGLKALPDYMDIESDESETSEELYLRIPLCTEAGQYTGQVKVTYHDGDYEETQTVYVNVIESPSGCEVETAEPAEPTTPTEPTQPTTPAEKKDKTVITVGAQSQDLRLGEGGAIYPITFTNAGTESKTYVVSVTGAEEWATVKISPLQTITLGEGESKSVYVYVSAKETALAAEHMFTVDVKDSEGNVVKQIPMTANVLEGEEVVKESSGLKKALEVGLIVLVIVLIIIALIVVFTKKKDEDEEEAEDEISGQTYY